MLLAYETVTVINREDDKNWTYHLVHNCSWHESTSDTLKRMSSKGAVESYSATISVRVPKAELGDYVNYKQWRNLPAEERVEKWTLKPSDYIVRGVWTPPEGPINFPDVLDGEEYLVIGDFSENLRQQMNPHIRIKSSANDYWGRV